MRLFIPLLAASTVAAVQEYGHVHARQVAPSPSFVLARDAILLISNDTEGLRAATQAFDGSDDAITNTGNAIFNLFNDLPAQQAIVENITQLTLEESGSLAPLVLTLTQNVNASIDTTIAKFPEIDAAGLSGFVYNVLAELRPYATAFGNALNAKIDPLLQPAGAEFIRQIDAAFARGLAFYAPYNPNPPTTTTDSTTTDVTTTDATTTDATTTDVTTTDVTTTDVTTTGATTTDATTTDATTTGVTTTGATTTGATTTGVTTATSTSTTVTTTVTVSGTLTKTTGVTSKPPGNTATTTTCIVGGTTVTSVVGGTTTVVGGTTVVTGGTTTTRVTGGTTVVGGTPITTVVGGTTSVIVTGGATLTSAHGSPTRTNPIVTYTGVAVGPVKAGVGALALAVAAAML